MDSSIFRKLLQDVYSISTLLNKYFGVVYGRDFDPKQRLTEQEKISKEEILTDLNEMISRFKYDTKLISRKVCNSKESRNSANRDLVDLINVLFGVASRLKKYGKEDAEVEDLRKILSNNISIFKESLVALNQRSIIKLYTWEEATVKVQEEMASLAKEDDLINS